MIFAIVYIIIHAITSVISYGLAFAYMQRLDIKNEFKLAKAHRIVAMLLCVWGPLNLIGVLFFTQVGVSGIKFWDGEKKYSDIFTIFRIRKQQNKYYNDKVVHIKPRCKDIWA